MQAKARTEQESLADTLRAARALIEKPENWCQGHYAMGEGGAEADIDSPEAIAWCANGALLRVCRLSVTDVTAAYRLLKRAIMESSVVLPAPSLEYLNDQFSHAEVLTLFDRAIDLAEAQS